MINRIKPAIFILGIVFLSGTSHAGVAAVKEKKPVVIRTMESAMGEVTRIEGNVITILYDRRADAEYEMQLPIDAKVRLERYRKLSEIQTGDEVELKYEKVVNAPKTPQEQMSRTVKSIRLVNRAEKSKMLSVEI